MYMPMVNCQSVPTWQTPFVYNCESLFFQGIWLSLYWTTCCTRGDEQEHVTLLSSTGLADLPDHMDWGFLSARYVIREMCTIREPLRQHASMEANK